MKTVLSYPLSILYYLFFGILLFLFQIIQWFCLNVFGYYAHKKSVDIENNPGGDFNKKAQDHIANTM